ncbi:DNA double-strand break repair Rad50 ATPase [Entamoeba marina]
MSIICSSVISEVLIHLKSFADVVNILQINKKYSLALEGMKVNPWLNTPTDISLFGKYFSPTTLNCCSLYLPENIFQKFPNIQFIKNVSSFNIRYIINENLTPLLTNLTITKSNIYDVLNCIQTFKQLKLVKGTIHELFLFYQSWSICFNYQYFDKIIIVLRQKNDNFEKLKELLELIPFEQTKVYFIWNNKTLYSQLKDFPLLIQEESKEFTVDWKKIIKNVITKNGTIKVLLTNLTNKLLNGLTNKTYSSKLKLIENRKNIGKEILDIILQPNVKEIVYDGKDSSCQVRFCGFFDSMKLKNCFLTEGISSTGIQQLHLQHCQYLHNQTIFPNLRYLSVIFSKDLTLTLDSKMKTIEFEKCQNVELTVNTIGTIKILKCSNCVCCIKEKWEDEKSLSLLFSNKIQIVNNFDSIEELTFIGNNKCDIPFIPNSLHKLRIDSFTNILFTQPIQSFNVNLINGMNKILNICRVEKLVLYDCISVTIFQPLDCLKKLQLMNCQGILITITSQQLERITITNSSFIEIKGNENKFELFMLNSDKCNFKNLHLTDLKYKFQNFNVVTIGDVTIREIKTKPLLTNIQHEDMFINKQHKQNISILNLNIKSIQMNQCKSINLYNVISNITSITLFGCKSINLFKCDQVKELKVRQSNFNKKNDYGLKEESLIYLDIDNSILSLTTRDIKTVQHFILNGCSNIQFDMPFLKLLTLKQCNNIYFINSPMVKEVNLKQCQNITLTSIGNNDVVLNEENCDNTNIIKDANEKMSVNEMDVFIDNDFVFENQIYKKSVDYGFDTDTIVNVLDDYTSDIGIIQDK